MRLLIGASVPSTLNWIWLALPATFGVATAVA
jgi:hypothetical protein